MYRGLGRAGVARHELSEDSQTMRIAIGGFAQESQSFSPVPGSWDHFGPGAILRGDEMPAQQGIRDELGGALAVTQAQNVNIAALLYARASSSAGPMRQDVFDTILGELLERLRGVGPVDGVLLVLHGALVTEEMDDGTGAILRAMRETIGADTPLVGTLDLHANVTDQMVRQSTALVGFHTAPHVDLYETGQRGMNLLIQASAGRVRPSMGLALLPMLLPGEAARTDAGPLADVMAQAEKLATNGGVLDVSVFSVQPWLDVRDVGCSVLVIADGDVDIAQREADRLASAFWARRHDFTVDLVPMGEAVARALASDVGPFVLADSADAPSSGAPGDSTALLRALLDAQPKRDCLLNIVDPPAVAALVEAGVGEDVTLTVGGRYAPAFYEPVTVTGRVKLLSDGDFVQKGAGFRGSTIRRGRTAVLQIGHIHLVVMERPCRQWEPGLYRSVGLEPADAQIVQVKSPAAFRAEYEPLAAEIMIIDAPGTCSPDLRSLPFRRVRRPLFPLDDPGDWRSPED